MAKKKNKGGPPLADKADKYALYQESVQSPEVDVHFFERVFRREYNRIPLLLREDFCGTAAVCGKWVASKRERTAIGVDLDPEPLAWGKAHNLAPLSDEARSRVTLLEADVRDQASVKAEVIGAQNFSFFGFHTRPQLLEYFRAAHRNLAAEGVLVLDVMGGAETYEEDHEEITEYSGFDYVWDQRRFDPITSHCDFAIHFRFKDGSALDNAFKYDWRLWTIPEIREVLAEAGYSRSDVYWESTDSDSGEGNGIYVRRDHAEADPAWVAYVVGFK